MIEDPTKKWGREGEKESDITFVLID